MADIQAIFRKIDEAVKGDPERASGLRAIYQFRFHEDERIYQLVFDGEKSGVVEGTAGPADCILIMTKEDFEALAKGNLNGTKAFMSGRLKIGGDKVLALKLKDLLNAYSRAAT
jgi:SCP-2 sterol transfer family.